MNAKTTAVLAGVAVVAAIALTAVRREHAGDAATAIARASTSAASTPVVAPSVAVDAARMAEARKPRLVVAYRLDPSLTGSLYMGDHWVTPARYAFSQQGHRFVVQAKLQAMDEVGSDPLDLGAGTWATQDPDMVWLTRNSDGTTTIEVRKPGRTQLQASAAGETRTLQLTATQLPDAMDVAIVQ